MRNKDLISKWKKIFSVLKNSITRRMLVVVFSIYLVLTISVTLTQMDFEYQSAKRQTILALENIRSMTQDSLSQAIWEYNVGQIDTIMKGIHASKFIVGESLDISDNDQIPELQDLQFGLVENNESQILYIDPATKNTTVSESAFQRLIPYGYDIFHTDANNHKQKIGHLTLYSSNRVVFEQVKANYIILLINAVIKTFALWMCFLWAGYKYISKPLRDLTLGIQNLAAGNWNSEIVYKITKKKKRTEINLVIDSFNEMTQKLHHAQINLEQSSNRLNTLFDAMPSALIFIDRNYTIKGWNKYMEQESGIAAADAMDQPLLEVYKPFTDYISLVNEAFSTNKEQQLNARLVHKQNADRVFNITVYPVITNDEPEAVIRIDDITEKLKNEAGMAQVEKLASVGALIAGIAHEINNPLGSIMQGTQNVLRRLDPALPANQEAAVEFGIDLNKQHQYLEKREIVSFLDNIRASGERASSIVKNMLKFTRRSNENMIKHNLVILIEDGLQLAATDLSLQEKLNFNEIKIVKNIEDPEIMIDCFPMEIQQVVLNLFKNAAQALEQVNHAKQITIELHKVAENKVQLIIADNGPGMPDAVKSQIFKPFFTTKPLGEGTGLGLSVCHNIIVQKHRGSMDVVSEVNKGTKFIICLPINQNVDK